MSIEAKCTYCGTDMFLGHPIDKGSCLCQACYEIDDLTYYNHKWMRMEEADKLEEEYQKSKNEVNLHHGSVAQQDRAMPF